MNLGLPREFSSGTIVQCLFLNIQPVNADFDDPTITCVLLLLLLKYFKVLFNHYVSRSLSSSSGRYDHQHNVLFSLLYKKYRLPRVECWKLISDYHGSLIANISKATTCRRIDLLTSSILSYFDAYIAQLPIWLFFLVYGTRGTLSAVWYTNIKVSDDARAVGFGQVVAIALLVIPLLAAAQMFYRKSFLSSCFYYRN